MGSETCGCFFCLRTYPPREIEEWVDDDGTPICPHCSVDSVIGSKSGFPITNKEFLKEMQQHYFGDVASDEFE
jgi:hypothetical protein